MNPIAQQALESARQRVSTCVDRRPRSRRLWTDQDIDRLRELYPDTPMPELVKTFRRPEHSIYGKAHALGLKRSDTYLASEHACRLRRENNPGVGSRFRKGETSWNKGVS